MPTKLWTEEGNPEGRSDEFWHQAEQESGNEDKSSPMRASYPNSAVDFSGFSAKSRTIQIVTCRATAVPRLIRKGCAKGQGYHPS